MMANGITNLRNPLDERLSQVFTPSADTQKVTGQQSLTESIARGTRAEQALPEVLSTGAAQERAAVEGLMRQRTEGAQRVGELGRQQAKETAAFEEQFQAMRPAPIEFAPSQENIGDLQNIMAQMVLIGGLIGGSSKRSGIAGLKAIKGMLDGYKQGRKDIFDREKLIYEKALDTQRNEITRIKDLYESQLRARTAGNTAEANALNAELNALTQNGTANIDLVRGDTKRVIDTLNYAISAKDKASALQEQIRSREEIAREARRAAAERAQERKQTFKAIGVDEEGRVVMANDLGEQRIMEGVKPASAAGGRFTQQQAIAQRAVNSLGGVASALESIRELPAGTTTGLLPNLQTKDGMINYVRNTMGRKIAPRDAEMMNTLFTGIGRNLASIESSGIATGLVELSKQMQSGTYINSGVDDPYKVAIKLADIRRIATENIRPAIESGGMPKQQAETAMKLVERIEQAIPFDTIDVVRAANAKGRPTIGERTTQAVQGGANIPTFATREDAQAAADRGEITAGTKIRIGNQTGTWR